MNIRRYRHLAGPAAIAAGAGLAAGLLYSLLGQGTVFAMALAGLAPLPIMIATLGFGRRIGIFSLVAAIVVLAGLAPVVAPSESDVGGLEASLRAALGFLFMLGLPALWLSFLVTTSRPRRLSPWETNAASATGFSRDFVPVERLVTACVAIAATIAVIGVIIVVMRHGSLDLAIDHVASELTPLLEEMIRNDMNVPSGYDAPTMAKMIVLASAPVAAGLLFLDLLFNLWLAAKVTFLSGQLARPWPDIAGDLKVPRPYGLLLGVAFATIFVGGPAGLIASIVGAVLAAAFALQGLAVVHFVSRDWKARRLMLAIIYGAAPLLIPFWFFLFVLLGLVESLYSFRNRKAATPPKI
jgi:hypothetical protein